MTKNKLAIIGGSGLYEIEGLGKSKVEINNNSVGKTI